MVDDITPSGASATSLAATAARPFAGSLALARSRATPAMWLLVAAAALELLYVTVFALREPLSERLLAVPFVPAWPDRILFATGLGCATVLYWALWRWMPRRRDAFCDAIVLGAAAVHSATFVAMLPVSSHDIFAYIFRSRILVEYHQNPFLVPPAAFPFDPLLAFVDFPSEPVPHGPVWVAVAAIALKLAGMTFVRMVLVFKLLAWLGYVASVVLLYLLLRSVSAREATARLILFAWNPILLFELAGNGHNDGLMVCLTIASLLALGSRRIATAAALLALAIAVKFVVLLFLPIVALWLWRTTDKRGERLRAFALWSALPIAFLAACYAPFWGGVRTLTFLRRGQYMTGSFASLLAQLLSQVTPATTARVAVSAVAVGLYALIFGAVCLKVAPTFDGLTLALHDSMLWYLLVACLWLQPWYLAWLAPLTSLAPGGWRPKTLVWVCVAVEAIALVGYSAVQAV